MRSLPAPGSSPWRPGPGVPRSVAEALGQGGSACGRLGQDRLRGGDTAGRCGVGALAAMVAACHEVSVIVNRSLPRLSASGTSWGEPSSRRAGRMRWSPVLPPPRSTRAGRIPRACTTRTSADASSKHTLAASVQLVSVAQAAARHRADLATPHRVHRLRSVAGDPNAGAGVSCSSWNGFLWGSGLVKHVATLPPPGAEEDLCGRGGGDCDHARSGVGRSR